MTVPVMTWCRRLASVLSMAVITFGMSACQSTPRVLEIGMTVHPRQTDTLNIERQFDLMAAMDAKWVRVDIGWAWIERRAGQFDWSYPDKVVSEAGKRGMKVLAVVATTPPWARAAGADRSETAPYSPPADVSVFANFARTAAERYAPLGVHHWEIWNEPNIEQFWPPRPDPDKYGALFKATADAVRGVDSEAAVLIGGLSPRYDSSPDEIAPTDYLERLYGQGAAQLADAVAAHPYTFPALPMESRQRMTGGFKDLPALHDVMQRHGEGRKKIWITEYGAPTGTGLHSVSEEDQAAAVLLARDQLERWDWSGPLIYYELVDGGTDTNEPQENFGLLREDLSLKPAALSLIQSAAGRRE